MLNYQSEVQRNQKLYSDSFLYEAFMTRADRQARKHGKGTDNGEFRLLEFIEGGQYRGRTYAQQMERLRRLIAKAVAKVLKSKLTLQERAAVARYAELAAGACDGDGLAAALEGLLQATQRLKEG